jgi:predicted ATPase
MKLLSITLDGEYKGLRSDTFDFSQSEGRLLAFIGLNGSGKSQLLELIGETFSYLERYKRDDFKVRRPLGFSVSVIYQINIENDPDLLNYPDEMIGADNHVPMLKVSVLDKDSVNISVNKDDDWQSLNLNERYFPIPNIVGYSSGLNENLQRSFMKNAVQFYDIMRVRKNRRKELGLDIVTETDIVEINERYLKLNPHIFGAPEGEALEQDGLLSLRESDTEIPKNLFMDYDCCALLMTSFAILPDEEINTLLKEIRFKLPKLIKLKYDLRRGLASVDAVKDIAILIRAGGDNCVEGIGNRTTDNEFDLYELDYLAGFITLDLSNQSVKEKLSNANYNEPLRLFERLYKIQLLGVSNWQGDDLKKLRKCDFIETVKKPLKTKLPLSVERLELADENGHCVNFDDFSDGEAQLIQILAAARIFRDEQTLFLFDEPETHLNPSWRTYFHKHLAQANQVGDVWTNSTQTLLSTHSPFMISSLKKSDVYRFERDGNGFIKMNRAENQTYGASFDVLIKEYFDLKSLISQTVVEDIKAHLPKGNSQEEKDQARTWLNENIGESMEKAYLLRKLQE